MEANMPDKWSTPKKLFSSSYGKIAAQIFISEPVKEFFIQDLAEIQTKLPRCSDAVYILDI